MKPDLFREDIELPSKKKSLDWI